MIKVEDTRTKLVNKGSSEPLEDLLVDPKDFKIMIRLKKRPMSNPWGLIDLLWQKQAGILQPPKKNGSG